MKKFSINFAALSGFALFFSAVLTLSSCSEEVMNPQTQETVPKVPVHIRVNDFSVSLADIPDPQTRAVQDPASYKALKYLTLAFYDAEGTSIYNSTQVKSVPSTFSTFGDFSCDLPAGTFTMVVIGRDWSEGDEFSLTSSTVAAYTSERVRETFCASQSVTVTNSTPLDLSVTLSRIVAQLNILSTDTRPEGISKIRTTYAAGSRSFNPTTGLAIGNAGFSLTNTPSSTAVGQTINVLNFAFLSTDEQTMDITLEVLGNSDEVLITKVIRNVPLKRNRKTILSGPVFSPSTSSVSFSLETAWDETTVNF